MGTDSAEHGATQGAERLVECASEFLAVLHPPQKDLTPGNEYALFPFDHAERTAFDYFAPASRFTRGLPLRYMNPQQRQAALGLLRASLSPLGFRKVTQIHQLEDVLAQREQGDPRPLVRDPLAYYVAVFGVPSPTGAWSWRYQGHHVALQWTVIDNVIVSSTPQFLGAQPAVITEADVIDGGLAAGTRVLQEEEDLARDLIDLLSAEQRRASWAVVPWDIETTTAPYPRVQLPPPRLEDRGVTYSAIGEDAREKLWALIREYAAAQLPGVGAERLRKIDEAGRDGIKFLFMGGVERGDALWYRVRGGTFEIQYVNKAFSAPELPADHQHSGWRDFTGDWGRDALGARVARGQTP